MGSIAVAGSELLVGTFTSLANSGVIGEYAFTTGSPINSSFITGLGQPTSMAVYGNSLYVADFKNNQIGQYNLGGGPPIDASLITVSDPFSIAILTPEPSTFVLLAIGAAALAVQVARRRRGRLAQS